ncbi:MAG TPA: DUF4147 domain-containing protein [Terriglobales bacterium]|jgi:hydroxypyruvate reductase
MSLIQTARDIFLSTLRECTVESAFARHVEYARGVLRVRDDVYDLDRFGQVLTIALGKAAHSMARALRERIGERATGIIAAPHAPEHALPAFRYFIGGHPFPNTESLQAGAAILHTLEALTEHDLVLFLLSGGGSAVVESPIDDAFTLEDIVATYRALVHSGANIAEINAIRKHVSATKGGRMAQAAYPAQQVSLMISDVPDSSLDALASGPTMPDSSTRSDCYAIAERYRLLDALPSPVRRFFESRQLEETPKADDPAFVNARWWTLLSSAEAQKIAAEHASQAGFAVEIDSTCDDWPYDKAADYLLARLGNVRAAASRACIISGGEVTVQVSGSASGKGGRNQHLALYCAEKIAGENIVVLSAGTDGIDGNSDSAGAIVDGTTLQRAGSEQVREALLTFDSNSLLREIGDTVETGPTGNNVRDLRILLAD